MPDRTYVAPHPARTPALLTCIFVWALMAMGLADGIGGSNPYAWHTRIPGSVGALVWGIPAALALWTLITRRGAWATVALLIVGPVIRALSYLWAWVIYLDEGPGSGIRGGYYYAGLHLAMVGIVVTAAYLTREDRAVRGDA